MNNGRRHFPIGFLWGSATAGHQVEGDNWNSDCWALEHAQPSIFKEPSGDAVDQWNRFDDDMALLSAIGLGAYRFGIEWSRIEPQEGIFSQAALDHYQRCIDACLQRGIVPIVTFSHFTIPLWVARRGGMMSDAFPALFARYCDHAARALRGIAYACTMNELNVPLIIDDVATGLFAGEDGPAKKAAAEATLGAPITSNFLFTPGEALLRNGLGAHAAARDAIKAAAPDIQVGITLSLQDEQAEPGAEAVRAARIAKMVTPFLDAVRGDDFIGVQTYTRTTSRRDGSHSPEPDHPLTVMGYEDRPQALAEVCRFVWEQTGTPILVTENGFSGDDDARRAAFVEESLAALHGAIADGVQVRGYCYWSLLDNYEWMAGYGPKFGLIGVDRTTQKRRIKPSALAYGAIARANGFGADIQEQSTPHLTGGTPLGVA
ncbi:family 1 glycosylhydrolase [uncultured Sphingomonas sp.]|uniref:glycoside hydrolase family 1 protein n=1 Tax=uncultured Sphingomonas sp. TaxID=158754 RepID=UPI0025F52F1A|nr:family 1 glycosylhydrolase [uncultured Sphingomonas sp.]